MVKHIYTGVVKSFQTALKFYTISNISMKYLQKKIFDSKGVVHQTDTNRYIFFIVNKKKIFKKNLNP